MQIPKRWGADPLSDFVQKAHENTLLAFQHCERMYSLLSGIDEVFILLSTKRIAVSHDGHILLPSFITRCQTAFRGGVRLALSGQVAEAYALKRLCLENALYASFICEDPARAIVWMKRGDSDEATKKCRSLFTVSKTRRSLEERDSALAAEADEFYRQTIDWGAHPNAAAHITTGRIETDGASISQLSPGTLPWKLCCQRCYEVASVSLRIFAGLLPDHFADTGASTRMEALNASFRGGTDENSNP